MLTLLLSTLSLSLMLKLKHVYSDHAYNEMTLITKHLRIPGKNSILLSTLSLMDYADTIGKYP